MIYYVLNVIVTLDHLLKLNHILITYTEFLEDKFQLIFLNLKELFGLIEYL